MRALLLILLAALLAPPAAGAPAPAQTWNIATLDRRRYVPIADVARFYRMTPSVSTAKTFRLTAANRVIEGRAGSSEVLINGVKYVTGFPLRTHRGRVHLSAMDVTKIIEPIMRPGKIQGAKPIRTVVLDAGHGGHDSGAVGSLGREKAYALDVALRTRALLLRAGFQVKMTRTADVFIPLEQRAAFANRFPDALFISIHFNKSNRGGTGIETYALAPRGVPSMDEASLRYSDFKQNPGNARDAENIALAAAIHSTLVRNIPLPDRGIKRARFAVIKNIRIPGVLVEGGFVDHALDARYIATIPYRQRLADSIASAVTAYTKTVTGAAKQPTATVTVGLAATPPPPPPPLEPLAPLDEREILAARAGDRSDKNAPRPASPSPNLNATAARPPAFNPGNPAFGRLPEPFDAWSQPPRARPFTTVNPFDAPDSAPALGVVAPAPGNESPALETEEAASEEPPERSIGEKRARPNRDFPPR